MLRTLFVLVIAAFGASYAVRAPFYALLLYLWIAYFRPESWVWGGVATALPLSLVAGWFLVLYSIFSGTRFRFNLRSALVFLLVAHSLVSTLQSAHLDYAWPYWTDFAKSAVITYLIACVVSTPREYRLTLLVIVLSLGFEVGKQGWVQLVFNPGEKNYNEHPILGDENGVALGVLMMVPLITALAQTARGKWERRAYALLTIGGVYRAISTYSRGGFLSSVALAFMYFIRSKHKLRTAAGVIVVALIVAPVMPDAFWDRMSTIAFSEDAINEEDNSSRGRLHFWRVALAMAESNPIFGVGHNAFNPHYDQYDFLDGLYGTERAVHSTWFGILAELGYVGALLFGLTFLLALFNATRVRRMEARGQLSSDLGIYATALERSLVVFAVGGTFLSAQYLEMLWHLIGLSMALSAIAAESVQPVEQPSAVATATGAPAFGVPVVLVDVRRLQQAGSSSHAGAARPTARFHPPSSA